MSILSWGDQIWAENSRCGLPCAQHRGTVTGHRVANTRDAAKWDQWLPSPALGFDGSRKCYLQSLHAWPSGWWHLSPCFLLQKLQGAQCQLWRRHSYWFEPNLKWFPQMLSTAQTSRICLMVVLHLFAIPFLIFFLSSSSTPSTCAVIMFTLSLMSSLLRGPRFDNLAFLGSCSIPQLLHLPSSRHRYLLPVQRPELDTTSWCFIVLHSNMFKYHVFNALANETQCFIAFGQLLQFELMIPEKTVTQPSSRSWNWRKCKCYLVKEVLLRILSLDALHHCSVLKCSCCLSNSLHFVRSLLVFSPHW